MKLSPIIAWAFLCQCLAVSHSAIGAEPKPAAPAAPAAPQVVRQKNITLAKETTRITAPLTDEGYPDYVAHLDQKAARGVTPQSNAVVLLWQIVGPKEIDPGIREEYFRRLGMPVPAEMGEYLLGLHEYATNAGLLAAGDDEKLFEQLDEAMRRPWTEKEFPTLAKWLAASQRPLKLAVEMSLRPHYYAPMVTNAKSFRMVAVLLPAIQSERNVGRALTCRAMLRLGEKNLEGAWNDVMAVRRLSRLVDRGPFIIDGLVAISLAGIASDAEAAVMHFGRPTRQQIVQFRRQRDAIGRLASCADRLDQGERMSTLDCVCGFERNGPSSMPNLMDGVIDESKSPAAVFFRIALNSCVDWDAVLETSNKAYDHYAAAARIQNWQQRNRAVQGYDQWIQELSEEVSMWAPTLPLLALGGKDGRRLAGKIVAGYGIAILMPALEAIVKAEQRIETIERRGAIVIALADYRADRGEYPADLANLVPKYIKALPRDAFTDAEFSYERTDKGFRLYTIGGNGIDDDGRGQSDEEQLGVPGGDDWLLTMPPKPPVQR